MKRNYMKGFSLIELLVVVAIIGVLGAIAYPNYQKSVRKGYRNDAQGSMVQMQMYMEQVYNKTRNYPAAGTVTSSWCSECNVNFDRYDFRVVKPDGAIGGSIYHIVATPKGNQTKDECGTLRLYANGLGTADGGEKCW